MSLKVYNTLTKKKELFEPINAPHVGMYVCGPTVYSDVHLGNCRSFTSFDMIWRYLTHLGYKVRYVRNVTDVGHLVNDADAGEDKIAKKAKLENLEPMEIVQRYTLGFREVMAQLNNIPPSIEPTATGHIIEQIQMTQKLLEKGMAYEVNGSVYFDIKKYNETYDYGILSGRVIEELLAGQRDLDAQSEKRDTIDFALWKKASDEHIMRWDSPWGLGFPGWHLECSVMSSKYLGQTFDIHGGGMDLKFPHHECEIAQSQAANGVPPVKYWLHGNMLTINGQKMSKSLGNSVLPQELFSGNHDLLEQGYSVMAFRFSLLQTHYRSTMDISNDALKAASKGYKKMINGLVIAKNLVYKEAISVEKDLKIAEQIDKIIASIYRGMDDDFNTASAIAGLFNLLKKINAIELGNLNTASMEEATFNKIKNTYITFVEDVLGLKEETPKDYEAMISIILEDYKEAKASKNYDKVDKIRASFKNIGITLKDMKGKIGWAYEES